MIKELGQLNVVSRIIESINEGENKYE